MCDYLNDKAIINAGAACFCQILVIQYTALLDDLHRQFYQGINNRVVSVAVTRLTDSGWAKARSLAHQGMGRQAILAAVCLADSKRK